MLQLYDRSNKQIKEVRISEGVSRTEQTFSNLIPGSKYNIVLTAVAGNKSTPALQISGSTGKMRFTVIHLNKAIYN